MTDIPDPDIIRDHGHQIISVFGTEDHPEPGFAYTVGRCLRGRPELVITGNLSPAAQGHLLNYLAGLEKFSDSFSLLELADDQPQEVIGLTAPIRLRRVDLRTAKMFAITQLSAVDGGPDPVCLQVIWPDPDGNWPDDPESGYFYGQEAVDGVSLIQPVHPVVS